MSHVVSSRHLTGWLSPRIFALLLVFVLAPAIGWGRLSSLPTGAKRQAGKLAPRSVQHAPLNVLSRPDGLVVRLDPALERVLQRDFASYRLPNPAEEDPQLLAICRESHPNLQVTYAVIGDFNGDGRSDAVLQLRGRKSRHTGAVVAFHATTAGSYAAHILERGPAWGENFCLTRVPRGRRVQYLRYRGDELLLNQHDMLTLRADGVEIRNPEAWARVYYWDGRRYQHVQTSD